VSRLSLVLALGACRVAEVDRETGQVTLLSYVGLHDCGTVVNPMLVPRQFLGAIAMGIGGALWEESVYGPDGRLRSDTLKRYLPAALHRPAVIETVTRETPSPFAMFGMKGGGERGGRRHRRGRERRQRRSAAAGRTRPPHAAQRAGCCARSRQRGARS